jgi:gluconolactonase
MNIDRISPEFDTIVCDPVPSLETIAHGLLFGEGPVWDHRQKRFLWVEIIGDAIWEYRPGAGSKKLMDPSCHANGMTFDLEGRLVVAGWASRSVWRMEHDGTTTELATEYEGKCISGPNDIVVRSDGSIYWTDPQGALRIPGVEGNDQQRYIDIQGVYCLTPSGEINLAIADCTYPNGLSFSTDEKILYVNDTVDGEIRAFDVTRDGSLGPGRLFYKLVGDEDGVADGMKVDQKDNVYCTGPGGIHVTSSSGDLIGRLLIPGHCTNMGWGDDDCSSLYVTTFHTVVRARLNITGVPVW